MQNNTHEGIVVVGNIDDKQGKQLKKDTHNNYLCD